MRHFDAATVEQALDLSSLIERLRLAFRAAPALPKRHHHTLPTRGGPDATLLLMPAWQEGENVGVKVVTVFPGNGARGLPSVMGIYLLLDGLTGEPQALIDGPMLTLRRTAATSALAASYLAHPKSQRLLMVGAGKLARHLIEGHATVRPLTHVSIWNRTPERAKRLAQQLARPGLLVESTTDLEGAARAADVISCATLSQEPLIEGRWLKPGAHVDLVGGYTPEMREADDEALQRARVFVDTREGALSEAGDIIQPNQAGLLQREDLLGDLFELASGTVSGRQTPTEITLFKSVGLALEDLVAAQLCFERGGHP